MSDGLDLYVKRSLKLVKTELEFLAEAAVISPEQLESLLDQLPGPVPLNAPVKANTARTTVPTAGVSNLSVNEKRSNSFSPSPQPPPAYPVAPAPPADPALEYAVSLYRYPAADAGDLDLQPQDRIMILDRLNSDWWKGRSERTGEEGIFPSSYVSVEEKSKNAPPPTPARRTTSNYGNVPLETSQRTGSTSTGGNATSGGNGTGKKVGKKLGNAALFGAGATVGSSIVGAIL